MITRSMPLQPEDYTYRCLCDGTTYRFEANLLSKTKKKEVTSLIAYGSARSRTITITSLFTLPEKRQNGLATRLLHNFICECLQNGYHTFLLDDCSDHFRQNDRNIYYKQGFRYVNEGQPELKLRFT